MITKLVRIALLACISIAVFTIAGCGQAGSCH